MPSTKSQNINIIAYSSSSAMLRIFFIVMYDVHDLKTAVADSNLLVGGINTAKGSSLAVGELVHSSLGNVEASTGVVHSKDVDGLAVVGKAVAGTALSSVVSKRPKGKVMENTYLGAVPAGNALVTTNEREAGKATLSGESVNQTVGSVGAGDLVHGATGVVVTRVVADCAESVLKFV
jgi:hypothetical protein